MHYSVYRNQGRRIPTPLVAVVVVLFVAFIGLYFNKQPQTATQGARVEISRSEIANIRDTTATIYWRTEEPTVGSVLFGTDPKSINQELHDDRDVAGKPIARKNHVATIKNLKPSTTYYYRIAVGGQHIGQSQTEQIPFSFITTRPVTAALDIAPFYGKITSADGSNLSDAVVLLTIQNTHSLLTITKPDGSFLYAPCCIFTADKLETYYPSEQDIVTVEIVSENGEVKQIVSSLGQMSPYPNTISMGGTGEQDLANIEANTEGSHEPLLAAELIEKLDPVDIMFPKIGAAIPNPRPLIKGVGEPDSVVKGTIEPDGRIFEARVDSQRNWQFSLPFDLTPGRHSLKINTVDTSGRPLALERSFTVLKDGEAVLGQATGSATITPSITDTPVATSSPTEILTPTPTIIDIVPTDVTATPPPPISGNSTLPFITMSIALIILGAGLLIIYQ